MVIEEFTDFKVPRNYFGTPGHSEGSSTHVPFLQVHQMLKMVQHWLWLGVPVHHSQPAVEQDLQL